MSVEVAASTRCADRPQPTAIFVRAFYFAFYGTVGCYLAFFAPYLRGLGFSGAQLGLVQMVSPVVSVGATLIWAIIADRLRAATRVLRCCALLALAPMLFLPWAHTPLQVGAVLLVHNLAAPALVPLIDSVTFEWLRQRGAGSYAQTRLFGTIGGLVLVQTLSLVLSARGDRPSDIVVPIALLGGVAIYAGIALLLPHAPPSDRPPQLCDLRGLLRDGRLVLLLSVCLVHWLCYAPYDLLFGVFMRDVGHPARVLGMVLTAGALSEAAMFAAFPWLQRRLRGGQRLALVFAAAALRWGLLSFTTSALGIASLQVMHGATSGLFWGTVVQLISTLVPARLRVTGHALFAAVVVGGGNALGYRLAGLGYDRWGGSTPLFRVASLIELVALLVIILFGHWLTLKDSK
jgi:MFS transporter, PPP family, 3-phenylpropionic acid transporter